MFIYPSNYSIWLESCTGNFAVISVTRSNFFLPLLILFLTFKPLCQARCGAALLQEAHTQGQAHSGGHPQLHNKTLSQPLPPPPKQEHKLLPPTSSSGSKRRENPIHIIEWAVTFTSVIISKNTCTETNWVCTVLGLYWNTTHSHSYSPQLEE